jgi:DNA-directed RNA polymerase subunit RPC12/RpoP
MRTLICIACDHRVQERKRGALLGRICLACGHGILASERPQDSPIPPSGGTWGTPMEGTSLHDRPSYRRHHSGGSRSRFTPRAR